MGCSKWPDSIDEHCTAGRLREPGAVGCDVPSLLGYLGLVSPLGIQLWSRHSQRYQMQAGFPRRWSPSTRGRNARTQLDFAQGLDVVLLLWMEVATQEDAIALHRLYMRQNLLFL